METGIVVAGTGYAGSALARELARANAPYVLLDKVHGEMLFDVILSDAGEVAGALVVRGGAMSVLRAPAVVLATGNVAGLFPGGDSRASGDGLVIAHRAGSPLSKPFFVDNETTERELRASVPCKPDGQTSVKGLFVAGSLGSDRPDPVALARAAVLRSRQGADDLGPYADHPTIDLPLPKGFVDVKFERLRTLMQKAVQDPEDARTRAEIHRLKGEADDYARARVDIDLFSFQNACEAALLLLRA